MQVMEIFKDIFNNQKIEISDDKLSKIIKFFNYLTKENESYNLTAITTAEEAAIRHFSDSLMLSKSKEFVGAKTVLDVGSGAGFPGIPLAIFYDDKDFTLLDSLQKRVNFLTNSAEILDLSNVQCIHDRAETFSQQECYRERYDIVTARAVADLKVLAEYCLPAVKCGGYFIAMKSHEVKDEITNAQTAIKLLGGGNLEVIEYVLPDGRKRQLVIIEKATSTPKKYPRRPGMPKKRPIS